MKIRGKRSGANEKVELQMTPMIDIVFQLLVFFIMTFNIVATEGDFNIRMPAMGAPQDQMEQIELRTLKLRMEANSAGDLQKLKLNDAVLFTAPGSLRAAFSNLHNKILSMVADAGGPDEAGQLLEVEFECDYNLKYNNVIKAITAVSGSKARDSDKIERLIENIKFAPPRKKAG
jgi:biopolymer transport protein ExbD